MKELWVVFIYIIFSFSIDSLRYFLISDPPAAFILLFTLLDYSFVFLILYSLLNSGIIKVILILVSILFVLYIALLFLRSNPQSYAAVSPVESILVLVFCIIFLFEQLNKPEELLVYSMPGFWIILAFLVYSSGTLFLYIFRVIDFNAAKKWWIINNVCNIITNCLIALSFFINYRNSKSQNPSEKIPMFDS
jgi:hypothetical protein